MCECGCMEFGEFWKLPGPKGSIYIIQKYPGCKNCSAPLAVGIQKVDEDHQDFNYHNETKEFEFNEEYDNEYNIDKGQLTFFSQEDLQIKLEEFLLNHIKQRSGYKVSDLGTIIDEYDANIIAKEFAEEFFDGRK